MGGVKRSRLLAVERSLTLTVKRRFAPVEAAPASVKQPAAAYSEALNSERSERLTANEVSA
jgi:hypothetical protein